MAVRAQEDCILITFTEQTDLEQAYWLIQTLLNDATWLPYAVYKVRYGEHGEIYRKQISSLYYFKKFDLSDFIEFILEGMGTASLESGDYSSQPIHELEIRSKVPLSSTIKNYIEGDWGLKKKKINSVNG